MNKEELKAITHQMIREQIAVLGRESHELEMMLRETAILEHARYRSQRKTNDATIQVRLAAPNFRNASQNNRGRTELGKM